jgi:hypothetical protein
VQSSACIFSFDFQNQRETTAGSSTIVDKSVTAKTEADPRTGLRREEVGKDLEKIASKGTARDRVSSCRYALSIQVNAAITDPNF